MVCDECNNIILQSSVVFPSTLCICHLTTTAQKYCNMFCTNYCGHNESIGFRYSMFSSKAKFTPNTDARFEMMHNLCLPRIKVGRSRSVKLSSKKKATISFQISLRYLSHKDHPRPARSYLIRNRLSVIS